MTDWKTIEDQVADWMEKHQVKLFLGFWVVLFLFTLQSC